MYEKIPGIIKNMETISRVGRVENVVGMLVEASGSKAAVGDVVWIYSGDDSKEIMAEVVGFKGDRIQLMTYGEPEGISSGSFIKLAINSYDLSLRQIA